MLDQFLEKLQGTRFGQSLLGEIDQEAKAARERAACFERLPGAKKRLAESAKITSSVLQKEDELRKLIADFDARQIALASEINRLRGEAISLSLAVEREEHFLRQTAPRVIEDFLVELRELDCETRERFTVESGELKGGSGDPWQRVTAARSNRVAVEKRRAAIRAAKEQAELLKLENLDHAGVVSRIKALRASIPSAQTLSDVRDAV